MLKVINGQTAEDSYLANEKFCLIQKVIQYHRDKSVSDSIREILIGGVI